MKAGASLTVQVPVKIAVTFKTRPSTGKTGAVRRMRPCCTTVTKTYSDGSKSGYEGDLLLSGPKC
jgi:hypothetical protein